MLTLLALAATDQEKEEEVQRVRLKNIHLNNQLKRIEQTLKQKEELAEGLHLIDFEQLKIENQVRTLTLQEVFFGACLPCDLENFVAELKLKLDP